MASIYLVTLAQDIQSPFAPKSDEVKIKEEKKESDKKDSSKKDDGEKKKKDAGVTVRVDVEGMQSRIATLPISGKLSQPTIGRTNCSMSVRQVG
jgi:tricorn protease